MGKSRRRRPLSRFWTAGAGGATRASQSARPSLEHLEERTLLSGVQPMYRLVQSAPGVTPLSSPSPSGYTPAQIRQAYGFNQIQLSGGITGDGAGQTVAIVDAYDDPNIQSDLNAFSQEFGLPTTSSGQFTFTKVNETGGSTPPAGSTSWAVEISLDVEWVHAIAPRANILLVEASDNSDASIYTAIDYAANQPGVSVVSMSFGESESQGELGLDSNFETPAGHAPVSFVASAGDQGAPPEYPSASPNVLAVGGTTLNLDSSGDYLSESAWSGGGGGISAYEPQPAYQKGIVTQSGTQRTTPDVAYDANPGTGFPVYDSYTYGLIRPWQQVGGTSAGAPQWSALIAIADEGRALPGEQPLDGPSQLLPMIYGLPSADLHDITTGSTEGNPPEPAGPGYDLATGLGSPFANLVVPALIGTTSPVLTPTSTSLMSSVNPTAYGESVTFTATVSASGATPAGSVTFMDGATALGKMTLTNGTATFTTAALPVGGDSITAAYGGNSSFSASTSPALVQTVVASASTVSLSSSLDPSTASQTVTFTATVAASAPGSGTPAGSVSFYDGTSMLGSGTLSGGIATYSTAALPVGSDSITAVYSGNGNFTTSTSPALTQTVNPVVYGTSTTLMSGADPSVYGQSVTFTATVTSSGGTPAGSVTFMDGTTSLGTVTLTGGTATYTTTAALPTGGDSITAVYGGSGSFTGSTSAALTQTVNPSASSVSLSSSLNPAVSGQSVTFTATVAAVAPGAGTPTGSVTFMNGTTTLGSGTLSGGVATYSTTTLPVGSDSITAVYSGDSNFTTQTSSALTQTVNPAVNVPTTTTLQSSADPSVYGQSVTFTATVTGSGGTPTGSVTFMNGTATLATKTLSGGSASFTTTSLAAGSYGVTAVYSGDTTFAGDTSTALTQTVNKATTTDQLTVSPSPALVGQTVTLTSTLSVVAPGGGVPGGTVTFLDGTTTLAMVRMSGGVATFQTTSLAIGTHSLSAVWHGDSNNIGSTSSVVTETVNSAGKTTSTTALQSSADPSVYGQSVTFTATVTGSGGTPTGTVTFLNGTATLGSSTLSNGTATWTTSALAPGGYSITAAYAGDSNFATSTSTTLTQTVNQDAATVALSSSLNPSTAGQSVTFTATVAAVSPGAGTPTGSVTFYDGSTSLGSQTLSGGSASVSTSTLPVGGDSITAVYSGDTNFTTETSSALTQTVNQPSQGATATLLSSSADPSVYGQSVTFTATVTGSGGTPTGTVSFLNGTATLATKTLSGGSASFTTSSLAAGSYGVTAVYSGSSSYTGSTSAVMTQVVNKATTTNQLTASPSLATAGQTVTLTAVLSAVAPGSGTIGGTVTFLDGSTTLGTARLSGGVATFQTSSLAVGTHSLTAVWHGDSNNIASTSPVFTETINPSGDAIFASLSRNAAPAGARPAVERFRGPESANVVSAADAVWVELQIGEFFPSDWLAELVKK
jgi:hypothetical protein